jgi:tRNA U34 5-carboxymethylaminomethyl modifying GTPase MnmE/TrmE
MITQEDVVAIADLVERKVLEGQEAVRQEFYGAIQQLISNQTALAEMVAMRQGQGEVATMLAHEFWQRSIMQEAQRVQAQLDAAWEEMKPSEAVQAEPEPEPESRCPMCGSDNRDKALRVTSTGYICNSTWH